MYFPQEKMYIQHNKFNKIGVITWKDADAEYINVYVAYSQTVKYEKLVWDACSDSSMKDMFQNFIFLNIPQSIGTDTW